MSCNNFSLLQFGDSLPATDADPTEAPTPVPDEGCEAFKDNCNDCVTASAGCKFVIIKVCDLKKPITWSSTKFILFRTLLRLA